MNQKETAPVQLQDGASPEWTCPKCGGDALFCDCYLAARAIRNRHAIRNLQKAPSPQVRGIRLRDVED